MKPRLGWGIAVLSAAVLALGGCGYTTKSLLPDDIRTVHVAPVRNAIDFSAEPNQNDAFKVYRPGLEVELTQAVINRFIFDGTLKITAPDKADVVFEGVLVDYRRDPLRYSEGEDVQEYRLSVVMDATLKRISDGKIIWYVKSLTGDATFYLSGAMAISEDEAARKAVEDTARRVVERTVEIW